MPVTDTNENRILNWNTEIQIAMKSYLITLKRLTKIQKTFLCKRITMIVALEAYLEPGETSTKELFCVNIYICKKTRS